MKMKVYVTRRIPEIGLKILREYCEVIYRDELAPPTRKELLDNIKDVDAIYCTLNERIDREVIDSSPRLKVVGTMSVGVDHIDIDYATSKGVYIVYTPGVLTETTADLAFALILSTARRVVETDRIIREGKWKLAWAPTMMLGYEVYGKTLGIIGLGRIGAAVARRAKGFRMKILYYDKIRREDLERELEIEFREIDDLLRESDFISIHVPLTNETRHLIGERELRLMKPTAILVNTSRGPVVDEKALVKALREGWIAGAGLDVFEEEPLPPTSPLIEMPNTVLTPHIGSATYDTRNRMAQYAAEGIIKVLKGEEPENLYNREVVKIRPLTKLID
ncbi:MAG: D-glycerate dehydrogenase [Aigarchaeota archaeon]|nr:D-glycerate dehydrogenase [Aigarchaeota archaeon]MCX8192921.1 glyoxylate reductase [Nitrososphaeria archaeon]MDW7986434.1 glyoxylate reductase [Nitrososphaerota archaeon]